MSRDVREHPLGAWKGRIQNIRPAQRADYERKALRGGRVHIGFTPDGQRLMDDDGDPCVLELPAMAWLDFITGEDSTGAWRIEQAFLAELDA